MIRRIIAILFCMTCCFVMTSCGQNAQAEKEHTATAKPAGVTTGEVPASSKEETEPPASNSAGGQLPVIYARVNDSVFSILPEENTSAAAFIKLLQAGDVSIEMRDYGNFEKVGPLGTALPRNDARITTAPGDVILYQGNQITIYYDVNSWDFTRLGKIQGISQQELKETLGPGDIKVTFTLSAASPAKDNTRTMVVFFSCTGHTKPLAEYAAQTVNADLYELKAKVPYTDDDIKYYTGCRADKEQRDPSARPEIAGVLPDLTGYDTVFLGYPLWHGQAPKIIYTFLESANLSGKRIIPFCTSAASPLGTSAENLHPLAPDSQWDEGRRFEIGTGKETISEWVSSLHIKTEEITVKGEFDFEKKSVVLNSGYEMPVIGLGTWALSNDEAENSVYHALKSGMRLIDTARYYQCEAGVGRGLQKAIEEGIVTRGDVFITSKIMPSDYNRAAQGINDSLRDLKVDYVDLMLIHQPGGNDKAVYKAMEDAVRAGKVRSIGISNYYTKQAVDEVLAYAEILPAVIQNENHLYYQNTALQEYVKPYGIVIESWYPFGGRGHTSENFNNAVIVELAQKYGKSSAQIILRWQLQAGFIAIPGSSNPAHIAENYDIFNFELTDEEMQSIRNLDEQKRYENW